MSFIKNLSLALIFLLPTSAFAEGIDSGDTAWILTATVLVLFMTLPGLALFYGGLVRSKNVLSILMQCFAITCVVTIIWVIGGPNIIEQCLGVIDEFYLSRIPGAYACDTFLPMKKIETLFKVKWEEDHDVVKFQIMEKR